jgi:hypothetical protein
MSNIDKDIKSYGFVVGGEYNYDPKAPSYFWAEITPSGGKWYRQFLPNVRRWWFEVHETEDIPTDEMGIGQITHAYEKYGSGGAYTLRSCIIKAMRACEIAAEKSEHPTTNQNERKED